MGVGLLLIGMPYAVLCGTLAALLRFIPYLGTWVAFILTLALSLAVFSGWTRPVMVVALFLTLELLAYVVFEPWLFSQSSGVSSVALLVAITFWTWAWGPVGLLLATPMTVCLLVLGRHLPPLGFFDLLLREEPVLDDNVRYYQRLLARDPDDAAEVIETHIAAHGPSSVYDEILLPAIHYAKHDRDRERLTDADVDLAMQGTREIVDGLDADIAAAAGEPPRGPRPSPPTVALGFPTRDEGDVLALVMVRGALIPPGSSCAFPAPSSPRKSWRRSRPLRPGCGAYRIAWSRRAQPGPPPVQASASPVPRSRGHRRTVRTAWRAGGRTRNLVGGRRDDRPRPRSRRRSAP